MLTSIVQRKNDQYLMRMIGGSNNSPVDHFYHQLPPTEIEKTRMG
jgi:hypothetical protein